MLYYRFKSSSELCFKELLYNEIYFSSPDECNDPFDSKTFYEFSGNTEKWRNLIGLAMRDINGIENISIDFVSETLSGYCPTSFDDLAKSDMTQIFVDAMEKKNAALATVANYCLKKVLDTYKPSISYFVSFSRKNNEPLMWSHYAARHEGYCLIFRSQNGALNQDPTKSKTSIRRSTQGGLAPTMSQEISNSFLFQDITYHPEVKPLCAFSRFPASVAGEPSSEKERLELAEAQNSQYLHKHISWEYEAESRLTLKPPIPWLFGSHFEFSKQERLFYYQPCQLAGIIFGARMSEENKKRILDILLQRQHDISGSVDYKRVMFKFVIFESTLSKGKREIEIRPEKILALSKNYDSSDPDFNKFLKEWTEGWGWESEGGRCTRVQVLN